MILSGEQRRVRLLGRRLAAARESVCVQMLWGERRGHMAPSALLRSTGGVPPCRNIFVLTQAGPSPLAAVGAIYLGGHLSSSINPTPAASSSDQAASSDQDRDRGKPVATSTAKTSPSPQGGSAKQASQQLAQSSKAPSQPPANLDNRTPAPIPSANAAAPSPAAAPSQPAHDHMAASDTPSPSATTRQSPAPPASNAATASSNAVPGTGDATAGRLVFRKCQACHSIEPGKKASSSKAGSRKERRSATGPSTARCRAR